MPPWWSTRRRPAVIPPTGDALTPPRGRLVWSRDGPVVEHSPERELYRDPSNFIFLGAPLCFQMRTSMHGHAICVWLLFAGPCWHSTLIVIELHRPP